MADYSEELVKKLVADTEADRVIIEKQLEKLTGYDIPSDEAEQTIRRMYADRSLPDIFDLHGVGSLRGHFLRVAGYEDIQSIAEASQDELNEVKYLGEQSVPTIHRSACRRTEYLKGEVSKNDEATESTDQPDRISPTSSTSSKKESQPRSYEELLEASNFPAEPSIKKDEFPQEMKNRYQWLLWEPADGRKIPRAPWQHGDLRYVNAQDPSNWTSFNEATEWANYFNGVGLAYVVSDDDPFVFVDLDNVRDPDSGKIDPPVRVYLDAADSYAAVSTSGTGLHILCQGQLGERVKTVEDDLRGETNGSIEIYDQSRFIAMTGNRLAPTPRETHEAHEFLEAVEDFHVTVSESTPYQGQTKENRDTEYFEDMDETGSIEDVFAAIRRVSPGDINLRSPITEKRGDGTVSYDPSWTRSDSGTRLAGLNDRWVYRKGMIALDALQVVALEERIISNVHEYPRDKAFWDAVEALRDRGAAIPEYRPSHKLETDDQEDVLEEGDLAEDEELNHDRVYRILNHGKEVPSWKHPYDRDYQEKRALRIGDSLFDVQSALSLTPEICYRAAELFTEGQLADILQGASMEATLGAAIHLASIEHNAARPLDMIADALEESPRSLRNKRQQLIQKTGLLKERSPNELVTTPTDCIPFISQRLDIDENDDRMKEARQRIRDRNLQNGSSPWSIAAGAIYAVGLVEGPKINQQTIADAAELSTVTVRNNYQEFL